MRALLVDDDQGLCELLRAYLEGAGFSIDTVHCGRAALNACLLRKYDIILLDVMLPHLDGYAVLARLRNTSSVPVIMLTAKGEESDRVRGLDAGADDYVGKPFSSRELVARMKALLRRVEPVQNQIVEQIGDLTIHNGHNHVEVGENKIRLTSAEATALRALCQRVGKPVSRDHLCRVVLHREHSPFDRSLDTHMSNLRRKLGFRADGTPRIAAVRGVGYQYCP